MRKYAKDLYSKEVILKSAYMFTDDYYIHLDAEKDQYCVVLQAKTGTTEETVYDQFENELIMQETRRIIAEKTKNIREMLVARSLSSTIVDKGPNTKTNSTDFRADEILKDWFENNE